MIQLKKIAYAVAIGLSGAALAACGGSDTQSKTTTPIDDKATPVAVLSSGAITAFGSVYVNGVKYDTSNTSFVINGRQATEDDLRVGMVVKVDGVQNGDAKGVATEISFDGQLEGPISKIAEVDPTNADQLLLEVYGIQVIVDKSQTSFDNVTFEDITALVEGEMLELSGYFDAQGVLQATYVEKEDELFVADQTEIELMGSVSELTETHFILNVSATKQITVEISSADIEGELVDGALAEISGTATAIDSIELTATDIEIETFDEEQEIEIEGVVQGYDEATNSFIINGITVDASNAEIDVEQLADDSLVEVEGVMINNVLVASEVELIESESDFDYELSARVASVDTELNTITFTIGGEDIVIAIDTRTSWEDETAADKRRFNIADLAANDSLEMELQLTDTGWYAKEIERVEALSTEQGFSVETMISETDIDVTANTINLFGAIVTIAADVQILDDEENVLTLEQLASQATGVELELGNEVNIDEIAFIYID